MKYFVTSKISENIHETPEGYLLCLGVPIARTGEMIYGDGETPLESDDDGRVLITREEAEVFRAETIASFEGKPVTITHPKEFVNPANWKTLAGGVMQNVRRGEGELKDSLIADLLITDSMAIALVKNGLREVSCGYEAEYTQVEEGKGYQTNIVGNHLALVQQGRAGSSYAINDHKGKGDVSMSKLEKLLAKLGITKDSPMAKTIDEAMKEDEKKDDKKDDKAKDEAGHGYDELVKMVKDLSSKIESMGKSKDESEEKPAPKKDAKKDESEDEGEESPAEATLEERLKVLEAAVQKLLERESKEDEVPVDEEEVGDEDGEEMESEDDDLAATGITGDAATEVISRAEILAPGIKATKDVKVKALKAAYATKDGKKIIESLTGGKAPAFDSAEKVETLFIAASELMKVTRGNDLSRTKTRDYSPVLESREGEMTAERMNEINAKHYNQSK